MLVHVSCGTLNATYAHIIIWNTNKIHPLVTEALNTPRRRVYEPCLVYIDDYPTTFQRASRSPPRRPSGNTAFATRRPSRPASIMHALHYSVATLSDWKQIKEIYVLAEKKITTSGAICVTIVQIALFIHVLHVCACVHSGPRWRATGRS